MKIFGGQHGFVGPGETSAGQRVVRQVEGSFGKVEAGDAATKARFWRVWHFIRVVST
jgi:hypothetical protein